MALLIGCTVHGIDIEATGISAAEELVRKHALAERATFAVADASRKLDFAAGSFDAIVCIDAISQPCRACGLVAYA
jgi:cyclopropane fatty-acyl-phospholipid synthase-like methyltransferase